MKNPCIGLVQMHVQDDKEKNLQAAHRGIADAVSRDADIVVLPEMFICPYITSGFPEYAEHEGGPAWTTLSSFAREHGVVLVGGTIPEIDAKGKIYNTCFVFDARGNQVGRHRKVHSHSVIEFRQYGDLRCLSRFARSTGTGTPWDVRESRRGFVRRPVTSSFRSSARRRP